MLPPPQLLLLLLPSLMLSSLPHLGRSNSLLCRCRFCYCPCSLFFGSNLGNILRCRLHVGQTPLDEQILAASGAEGTSNGYILQLCLFLFRIASSSFPCLYSPPPPVFFFFFFDASPLHPSTDEFPNGNIKFTRAVQDYDSIHLARSVGWATKVSRHYVTSDESKVTVRKKCLGARQCPFPGCRFAHRPQVTARSEGSRRSSTATATATATTSTTATEPAAAAAVIVVEEAKSSTPEDQVEDMPGYLCSIHQIQLEHIPCNVLMDLVEKDGQIEFTHHGYHQHRLLLPKRASQDALQHLETIVSTATDGKPKHFLHQTELRNPISNKYPVFRNLSYLRYRRNKVVHKNRNPNNLGQLAAMEEVLGSCFIRSSSIRSTDGHISVQTNFIQQHCQDLVSSMQTDSVHGIISDDHYADINIAFTSAYCPVLKRTLPLIMSILFGRSSLHYKQHFLALLKSLPFEDWADFDQNFPGMTCDFADAERIGFQQAVIEHFGISEDEFILERHYGFCSIHFERSVVRVRRNGAVIPHTKEMDFYDAAMALTNTSLSALEFEQAAEQLRQTYPKCKRWLDFYLQEDRSRVAFPALSGVQRKESISKDTNAQESLGGDFKAFVNRTTPTCSIIQGVSAMTRYQESFFADFDFASQGGMLRYADKRKTNPTPRNRSSRASAGHRRHVAGIKLLAEHNRFLPENPVINTKYSNDGRAPDTTSLLLARNTRSAAKNPGTRGPGRPKNSRNQIPTIKALGDINWKTFGIPWRGQRPKRGQFTFENSCPLDTTLMAWFILSRYAGAVLPSSVAGTEQGQTLLRVMEELRAERYDHARKLWCTEVLGLADNGHHNLYQSLEEVFLDRLPGLSRFEASRVTECSRSGCVPKVDQLTPRSVVMLTPQTITQDTFDHSWKALSNNTCSEKINISEGDNSDALLGHMRLEALNDLDGEVQFWHACTGRRESKEPMMLATFPYLLVLDCLQASHESNGKGGTLPTSCTVATPPDSLTLAGEGYKLGAILYGNGRHFCCSVFVANGAFTYDGLYGSTRLHYVVRDALQHPTDNKGNPYQIVNVWYIRESQELDPSILLVKNVSSREQSKLKQDTTNGAPQKTRYAIGLSVHPVSNKGKLPICGACDEELERGGLRFIVTTLGEVKKRVESVSYHFTQECMAALPPDHHREAQAALDDQ